MLKAQITETPGQAPSLSRQVSWVLLRALHNTRDLQLYVPSEGRSNYGLSVLLKDTSAATVQARIRTHILTTPELESNALLLSRKFCLIGALRYNMCRTKLVAQTYCFVVGEKQINEWCNDTNISATVYRVLMLEKYFGWCYAYFAQ